MSEFIESTVASATLAGLESPGWAVKHGPEIAPDGLFAERADYREVVLTRRLRDALARLSPDLPQEALEDAFRRLTQPEGATPEARNRAFHRMLVDGVTVEYRRANGSIAGRGADAGLRAAGDSDGARAQAFCARAPRWLIRFAGVAAFK